MPFGKNLSFKGKKLFGGTKKRRKFSKTQKKLRFKK
jgi:hypothetical protein